MAKRLWVSIFIRYFMSIILRDMRLICSRTYNTCNSSYCNENIEFDKVSEMNTFSRVKVVIKVVPVTAFHKLKL